MRMPELLLHICCAPCATYSLSLLAESFNVTGFFYNPNIHPGEEYALRRREALRYFREQRATLVPSLYRPSDWFSYVEGHETDHEGGDRCALCFRMRLVETARAACSMGFDYFATTLTISPHKDAALVNRIGCEVAKSVGIRFLEADFKKGGGYAESCRMSRESGLYRQRYCGCIFSAVQVR